MDIFRQGPLVRNSLWESLVAGAIGTHIFAWHDRPYITEREKGFGILYADRSVKPAYWVCRDVFTLMEQTDIHGLLYGSEDPTPDIAFLWTAANDSQYNRYECEMQQIAGALEAGRRQLDESCRETLLTHTPPRDTQLDAIRHGDHVGSSSVREFIELTRPALVICGHIHEARGIDRLGPTQMVNCGTAFRGHYALVEVGADLKIELRTAE
jgi:hypothetical protein